MINIAVCDDDIEICTQIENTLFEYAHQNLLKLVIHVFYSGESLLDHLNGGNTFDLIYLDIKLKKINGVEVGKYIRKVLKDYITDIVFISGTEGYERQLFDVHPLHFIPKPIMAVSVINDLLIALERKNKLNGCYQYKKGSEINNVSIGNIIYFESLNRRIKIVTTNREDIYYDNLGNVMQDVSKHRFLLIHRSYLINYQHAVVLKYSEIIMSNGDILPISRAKRKDFRSLQVSVE